MTEASIEAHGEESRLKHLLLMDIEKNCFECRHLHDDEQTCDAFPAGIPSVFLYGDETHDHEYAGDHGVRFEPRSSRPGK